MTAPLPSLVYTDDQVDLRSAVRDVLEDHAGWTAVLERLESNEGRALDAWQHLVKGVGVAGLAVAETAGGAGGSWSDVAVVLEELGRSVAPTPFFTSSVIASALLQAVGETDLLASIAGGERVAAVLFSWGTPSIRGDGGLAGVLTWQDEVLNGTVPLVAGVQEADVLLVVQTDRVLAVEAMDCRRVRVPSLDQTRPLTDVELLEAPARVIADGSQVAVAAGRVEALAMALLASEQVGLAEQCLQMTLDHVKSRRQFGRQIGSFQAVKHRLADLWVEVARARAVARFAAACASVDGAELEVAGSLAQSVCGEVALHAAEECVQLHGGIGFTWEHPAHLYLKRARANALALGSPAWHRARLGDLLGLTPISTTAEGS